MKIRERLRCWLGITTLWEAFESRDKANIEARDAQSVELVTLRVECATLRTEAKVERERFENLANLLVSCPECGGVYNAASTKLVWVKVPQENGAEPKPVAFCKWEAQSIESRHGGRIVQVR